MWTIEKAPQIVRGKTSRFLFYPETDAAGPGRVWKGNRVLSSFLVENQPKGQEEGSVGFSLCQRRHGETPSSALVCFDFFPLHLFPDRRVVYFF